MVVEVEVGLIRLSLDAFLQQKNCYVWKVRMREG